MADDDTLDAGDFGEWLHGMRRALRGEQDSDVPCDGCTACCTGYQFVHVGPDEKDALAHIPPELLFPAPLVPRGQMVLGYDDRGRCPMLGDAGCTIYEHRPRTCRTYDCRVFTATGVDVDDPHASDIASRVRRWRFRVATPDDATRRLALEAAARRLRNDDRELDDDVVPSSPTQVAVLAVEIHEHFLVRAVDSGALVGTEPSTDDLTAVVEHWSPV